MDKPVRRSKPDWNHVHLVVLFLEATKKRRVAFEPCCPVSICIHFHTRANLLESVAEHKIHRAFGVRP